MKVLNAYWDERITGLKTCEIIFEKGDTYQMYLDSAVEETFHFSVIKIPVSDLKLVHQMEEIGYRYLENQITISLEVDQTERIDQKWKRFLSGFSYYLVTDKIQLDSLIAEVEDNMFETDRISLDPYFSNSVSSRRYSNWINDMYEIKNSNFYITKKGNENAGFFSIKSISERVCSCPIAGIYNKYKTHGFFFALTWFWLAESKIMGYRKLISSISTNNKAIHSFLSRVFFFRIDETVIVLRKVIN